MPNEYSASRSDTFVELTDSLTFLEIFLINKDYVAGDTLTIADISLLANVTLLEIAVEFDLSSYPNIWGWFNRLRRELTYYDRLTKVAHDEHREHIKSVRDAHEECIQLLMRFEWFDERLAVNNTKANKVLVLEGGQWHVNRIWTPSLHIPNNKQPDILQTGDQNPVLTHIQSDGKVLVSKRLLF
ncbi:unnamed protein product [Oppiella nova]|uniref:GST C-terminal domain-containing protein n=1 Tax=Oppiella nova TaxID=334625 RepID=A0A7R9QVJ6_9ACAR|nr:unnamed protein product [Oppiella nova]CAG2177154.1 unnamed protein product [Oppiella nova]